MKTTLLAIVMGTLITTSYFKLINIDPIYLIVTTIILIILTLDNNFEGMTSISNEGIQSLSSIYNTQNAVLSNLQVTGTLKVGNNVLIDGNPNAQDKIQIYQNGNGLAPYMYFNKQGSLGIWDGKTSPYYMALTGSYFTGNINNTGDAIIGSNLILDGTNKWILHTPDDGRKSMYMAPINTDGKDWNWSNSLEFNGTTGKVKFPILLNDGFAGFIGDGGGGFVPLAVGQGSLTNLGFCVNCEDFIILAPGYGIKLWNQSTPPDYNGGAHWQQDNTGATWKYYSVRGSNKMDYYKVYQL